MGRSDLVERLTGEAEEQYRIFNQKFVVTNSNPMLGVKVPRMRAIAREIAAGDWREFLRDYGFYVRNAAAPAGMQEIAVSGEVQQPVLDDKALQEAVGRIKETCSSAYFEEIMIIGMVINLVAVEPDVRLQLVEQFVPLIDNWGCVMCSVEGPSGLGSREKGPRQG